MNRKDFSPGPGAYDKSSYKAIGNGGPKASIKGRPQTAKPVDMPGPGQYDQSNGFTSP